MLIFTVLLHLWISKTVHILSYALSGLRNYSMETFGKLSAFWKLFFFAKPDLTVLQLWVLSLVQTALMDPSQRGDRSNALPLMTWLIFFQRPFTQFLVVPACLNPWLSLTSTYGTVLLGTDDGRDFRKSIDLPVSTETNCLKKTITTQSVAQYIHALHLRNQQILLFGSCCP